MYDRSFEPDIERLLDLSGLNVEVKSSASIQDKMVLFGRAGLWFPQVGINDRNIAGVAPRSRKMAYMEGYFQNFWKCDDLVKIAKQLSMHLVDVGTPEETEADSAILHLRGLDFQEDSNLSILTPGWFQKAVATCYEDRPFDVLKVVTDDIDFARTWLPEIIGDLKIAKTTFHSSRDPLEDFHMVLNAPRRIIGNSTFAQWALLLDHKKGKTVSSKMITKYRSKSWSLPFEKML